jgi:acetylornithine deacetylase/succinyl-diaminopimelate desuccinylase
MSEVRRMPGGMATLEHLPAVIDPAHPLACATRHACEAVTGIEQTDLAFPAWTDAGLLSNFASIPCVILGPGDLSVAHTPWESVPLSQVTQAVSIYSESARRFCSGAA